MTSRDNGVQAGQHEALLADDVIVAMHAHHERDDHFLSLGEATPRVVSPTEADAIAASHHGIGSAADLTDIPEGGPRFMSRRTALRGGAALLGAMLAPHVRPRYSFATTEARDTLVVVFLRGGMDGLSALVPANDPAYYAARGPMAVPAELTLPLDGQFAMHGQMSALLPVWEAGELAFVTGVGAPWASRSHFSDQTATDRCAPAHVRSGWVGRHLASASTETGTLRGVTIGSTTTLALATNFPTLATWTIDDFDIRAAPARRDAAMRTLDAMYGEAGGAINTAAQATFDSIDALGSLRGQPYVPEAGTVYPNTEFGTGMKEIARLMKAGLGMEVACIDIPDWDMHQDFGTAADTQSKFSSKIRELSEGVAALRSDLGERWQRTTVVTVSEFGRRVELNGTGFDHGSAGLMAVAGGGIHGGRVYGSQPPLTPENLARGDLPITVDFRQVLAEIVTQRLHNPALDVVLPDFVPGPALGIA